MAGLASIRGVALLGLCVVVALPTALADLQVEVHIAEGPLAPGAEVRTLEVVTTMPCTDGAATAASEQVFHFTTNFTTPTGVVVGGPLDFIADATSCLSPGLAGDFVLSKTYEVAVNRDAPGLKSQQVGVEVVFHPAVEQEQRGTGTFNVTGDYAGLVDVKVDQRMVLVPRGATVTVLLHVTNLGNARTIVNFASDGYTGVVRLADGGVLGIPQALVLDSPTSGPGVVTKGEASVVFTAPRAAFGPLEHRILLTPSSADEPDKPTQTAVVNLVFVDGDRKSLLNDEDLPGVGPVLMLGLLGFTASRRRRA